MMTGKSYLSIDIGGTRLKYALIDRSGNIISKGHKQTPHELENFLDTMDELIEPHQESLHGIAISSPGKVDTDEGVIYFGGSLPMLHELNLPKYIKDKFDLKSSVINDGKAAALAELWRGNLQGIDNGAAIILGTGVGGGLILEGKLLKGQHFQAGELSFQLATGTTKNRDMSNFIGFEGSAVKMIERCATVLCLEDRTDGQIVFEYLKQNNGAIYPIFQDYCRVIAELIYNVQAVIDVERYVIGGGISAQKILVDEIKEQYRLLREGNEFLMFMTTMPEIEPCAFRNEANLLGALYQFLLNEEGNFKS
ncbi:ROK family protein [Streptococcus castoreus]|uniref:ROK family protein n=1 Tax=Streptococcus castoreus TaxID=254786 RepID=UPI00040680D2|nr:ROK family protein [Streptococcus castoreus]